MKTSIYAFSLQGRQTAEKIMRDLDTDEIKAFAPERLSNDLFAAIQQPTVNFYHQQWIASDAMIFIGACGIAVRSVAPFVKSKKTDPAIICVDETGKFVIPLLSGHIGGANKLAEKIAADLQAQAVITTATDIHHRFAVDTWAVKNNYIIDNMARAKEISARILENDIPFVSDLPVLCGYPDGLYAGEIGEYGIYLGWRKSSPFSHTLRIIPKCLHLGIGCRKGIKKEKIKTAILEVLRQNDIDSRAIIQACSITLKANEQGLLDGLQELDLPAMFYSPEELILVPGKFSDSDFVRKITGVGNVCERAAMKNADKLIVTKTAIDGVTVAIAASLEEVNFE